MLRSTVPAVNETAAPPPTAGSGEGPMDFEYIIVGGGLAGCVPANRVLLIESGVDTPPGQEPRDILDTFPRSASNPLYKWMQLLAYTQPRRAG